MDGPGEREPGQKIKLLCWMDDPAIPTGFGTVARYVLRYLYDTGDYDIHICALNWAGDEYEKSLWPYRYHSVTTDLRGIKRTAGLIQTVQPDAVFILNDPDWLFEMFKHEAIRSVPTVVYGPIDGDPFPIWWLAPFRLATKAVVYTEYAKRVLHSMDADLALDVVGHGHDDKLFYHGDKAQSRALLGLNQEHFIVLRVDRNSERKDWPATFEAFAKFAKDKPEARLYAHCLWETEPTGWTIPDLIQIYGLAGKVINTRGFEDMRKAPGEVMLNAIFNAADVFMSTSKGEGWGLNVHQARACGLPVIAPDNSSMPEVVGNGGELIKCLRRVMERNCVGNRPCDVDHAVALLNKFYASPDLRHQYQRNSVEWAKNMDWSKIVPVWDRILKQAIAKFPHQWAQIKRWEYVQVDDG